LLREILEIYDVKVLIRFSWLKIDYSGGLLWTLDPYNCENILIADRLIASQ
jgi:hypothetical protein